MTLEDFAESVLAGWIPLGVNPICHAIAIAWHWIYTHAPLIGAALVARLRR